MTDSLHRRSRRPSDRHRAETSRSRAPRRAPPVEPADRPLDHKAEAAGLVRFSKGILLAEAKKWAQAGKQFAAAAATAGISFDLRIRALLEHARCLTEDWELANAEKAVNLILKIRGLSSDYRAQALAQRAEVYWAQANWMPSRNARAIADCDRALALPELSVEARARILCVRGRVNFARGNGEAAIKDFDQALALPRVPLTYRIKALFGRGDVLYDLCRYEEALEAESAVLALEGIPDADRALAHCERAWCHLQFDRHEEQVADCSSALAIGELDETGLCRTLICRGIGIFNLGRQSEGLADLNRAVAMKEIDWDLRGLALAMRGAAYYDAGQHAQAVKDLTPALQRSLTPELHLLCQLYRGLSLMELNRLAEGLKDLNRVIKTSALGPEEHASALISRGLHFEHTGKLKHAAADYQAVTQIRGAAELHCRAWGNLGSVLMLQGKFRESIKASERCLELDPEDAYGWCNLGSSLLFVREPARALQAYKKGSPLLEPGERPGFVEELHGLARKFGQVPGLDEIVALLSPPAERRRRRRNSPH